jgi:hypothetical protein
MRYASSPLRRQPAAVLLLVGLCSSSGCVPGVAWLPDSSGFIYTTGKQFTKLAQYDLATGQSKILVEDTAAPTLWPALSPDAKRIAVGRLFFAKDQKQAKIQVIIYDRSGKELRRSKTFDWPHGNKPAWPQLHWAPRGERIIIHTVGEDVPCTGIYDVQTDRLLKAGEGVLLGFGGTPLRPDGAGFLVMKNARWPNWWDKQPGAVDPDPRFVFMDWEGREKSIKAPAYLLDGEALKKEKEAAKLYALLFPVFFESHWQGDIAEVSLGRDRLRYFTARGAAVLDRVKPQTTREGNLVVRHYPFPGGKATLRVVSTKQNPRLEVVKGVGSEPEVVVKQLELLPVLIPSPTGKQVAVWANAKGGQQGQKSLLLVVNDQGEVGARIELGPLR